MLSEHFQPKYLLQDHSADTCSIGESGLGKFRKGRVD